MPQAATSFTTTATRFVATIAALVTLLTATIIVAPPSAGASDDGLILFENASGYTLPESQKKVIEDAAEIYQEVADGRCDFGEVFTTDGRLRSLNLYLVVDPGVFYVYNVSFNVRSEVYDRAPKPSTSSSTTSSSPSLRTA